MEYYEQLITDSYAVIDRQRRLVEDLAIYHGREAELVSRFDICSTDQLFTFYRVLGPVPQ